ncbi:MAG TPA: FkbM family methyltransferase [Gemmataceae bacterium]|nr:FkbM family methyltransferase [Gemmataceae bacterium]
MSVMRSLASAARGALWLVRAGGLREHLQRLLQQEQRRRWRAAGDLRAYERRVYSQNGEDGIIQEILARIGVLNAVFVEVGVESGRECNCARLVLEEQWRGVFCEADDGHFVALAERYRGRAGVRCVHATVASTNIEELLQANKVPRDFDVLSIDIDGNDYWVWAAVESWRPRLVVIEYNAAHEPTTKWVMRENPQHRWDQTSYYGASLASLVALGRKKGYTLVATDSTGVNAFFVRDELATPERFLDPVLHYHYSPLNSPMCPGGHPYRGGPFVEI